MNDDLGPEKVIKLYDPKTGMTGIVCLDNTKLGPAKGGCRMRPDVTEDEVMRLARAMSLKCSMAGLPFGGGKSGIIADPRKLSPEEKKGLVVAYGRALKNLAPAEYITAPDMNMAEEEMRWIVEGNGNKTCCTGKPKDMGGLPHELGSTGFGVVQSTLVGLDHLGLKPADVTFAVEGFGNVGEFASKFLTEKGAKLVAVSDSRGLVVDENGLNFDRLKNVKHEKGSVISYGTGDVKDSKEILNVKADVLITAAIKDLISDDKVESLRFKLIVQGSNIPMTFEGEKKAHTKGILVIPDFVANAGGVISSYVESINGTEEEMWKMVEEKIVVNTKEMLSRVGDKFPREVAMEIARERILKV